MNPLKMKRKVKLKLRLLHHKKVKQPWIPVQKQTQLAAEMTIMTKAPALRLRRRQQLPLLPNHQKRRREPKKTAIRPNKKSTLSLV